ncbi:MAG: ribosomal RNA small subunit methyltransferase A, partial [Chloroflexota bacterium]
MGPTSRRRRDGQRPKKSLGQHFLTDRAVAEDIVQALDLHAGERLLEIGAGHGMLTRRLLEQRVEAAVVEVDADLIPELESLPVRVIHADILRVSPGTVFGGAEYKVVGNIPYYISSPILRHLLESRPQPVH